MTDIIILVVVGSLIFIPFVGVVVAACLDPRPTPEDCPGHEWWDPSLHMSEKTVRCIHCSIRRHVWEQAEGGRGDDG